MLLVIDIGNTNIVYGLFDGQNLIHQFRVESARGRTADEYSVALRQLLATRSIEIKSVDAAMIASVVPSLTEPLCDVVRHTFLREPLVVGPGIRTGLPIVIDNPREAGADRIVNSVAAFDKVHDAVIVVDFGTATTFDCVSAKGEYIGGAICPGIQISADALFARGAKLPRVEIQKPAKAIGKNTVSAIQSGLVFGYVGLVDGLVVRLKEELGKTARVLATGGLARLIAPLTTTIDEVSDDLTLVGLRILYERNLP